FVHDHVVEGVEDAVADPRLEQRSALQLEVASGPAVERLPFIAELDLREEPETAGIDPQDRDARGRRLLRRPQQGAIAPDAHDQPGAVEVTGQRTRTFFRGGAVRPDTKPARLQLPARPHHRWAADVDARMADDSDGVSHGASNRAETHGSL